MISLRWACALWVVLVLSLATASAFHYGKGPKPSSTNAPGENSCQADQCHTQYDVNSGEGTLRVDGVPATYKYGEIYILSITLEQTGQKRWGFQITALDTNGQTAGEFSLQEDELTQIMFTAMPDGTPRQYGAHTLKGSHMGRKDGPVGWHLVWKAPSESVGPVYFYTAGNAANFNKKPWGDFIYTRVDTSQTNTPGK
jgi:hypothetical protein